MTPLLRIARIVFTLLLLFTLTGCGQEHLVHQLQEAQQAFDQQEYAKTKRIASTVASAKDQNLAAQGQYLAGVSSRRLGNDAAALSYLKAAAQSNNRALAGDSWAELGFVYNKQNQFKRAAEAFSKAAQHLNGQDRANAYFQAGIAQQKLGYWPAARSSLTLARGYNKDPNIQTQIQNYLNTVGFTLQVGAYRSHENAQSRMRVIAQQTQNLRVGLPQLSSTASIEGGAYYRVHIGRFTDYASAARARQMLHYQDALIVPLSRNQ